MSILTVVLWIALLFAVIFTLFAPSLDNGILYRIAGLGLPVIVMMLSRFALWSWLLTLAAILLEIGLIVFTFMKHLL